MRGVSGFTLWELLVAVTVAGVVAGLGIPALGDFVKDARRARQVNSFVHSLHLARSESAKRGKVVVLCKSTDGEQCAKGAIPWSDGWLVFVNDDRDVPARIDPGETVLFVRPRLETLTVTANRNAFSYRPFGRRATNGTLVFCDDRGPEKARAVIVSYTGRPRTDRRSASGKPLVCP